jgi:aldose 1-epimerase
MLSLRGNRGDSLVVAPQFGGAILGWMNHQQPLLRHAPPEAAVAGNPHAMGCFPLVPYGNRIALGRFHWAGRDYQLTRNFGDHPHSIHGVGWQRPWTVEAVTETSTRLSLLHTAEGEQARTWPFAFAAAFTYALEDGGLVVTLTATNRHDAPAPMGLGLHPYFPRVPGAALHFQAAGVWINGSDSLPAQHTNVPSDWDHAGGLPVGTLQLDNCFTGWTSPARLEAGPASLDIRASQAFGNLQVFAPPRADFYCAEPVSHIPDAINRPALPPGQAMRVLAPGETMTGTIAFLPLGAAGPSRRRAA